jgi:hypothetical protein
MRGETRSGARRPPAHRIRQNRSRPTTRPRTAPLALQFVLTASNIRAPMRATRAAPRAPKTVLLTALALLALHLGQLGHLVVARHGICPEHGEMIELGPPAPETGPTGSPERGHGLVADRAELSEHAHCPVLYGRRDAILPAPPVVRVLTLHPAPSSLATPAIWPPDFSGRICVAPKQSPPAA